uniref:Uncharacterized protein n=1 Tax=Anopheles coluzzii TaxID=1518534 RepID=A0A8W7PG72_ANOCL
MKMDDALTVVLGFELKLLSGLMVSSATTDYEQQLPKASGLWPSFFNVALRATISVNATCGPDRPRGVLPASGGRWTCGICDANNPDPEKRHPITNIVDGTNSWWQSPTLQKGAKNDRVTINLDLGQLYQIVFFTMRAAISPLPAAWVLEKSMDGRAYDAWQYFAADDTECRERFGLPAYTANYIFKSDTEVICSTQFSSLEPLENGEINLSIISGRPSEMITSPELQNFTLARYVRIRLLRMQSAEAQAITDQWIVCQTIQNHVFRAIVHLPERLESVVRLEESVVAWKASLVPSARNACQDIRAIGALGAIVMHEAHFRGGNAMRDHIDGCLKCYCSGVGTKCSVAHVETSSYTTLKGWTVTNLAMSEHIVPTKDNDTGFLVFGMFEMPETEAVYWKAPEGYLGNLLRSYGSQLTFKMDWITVRGDTSGKPTVGPSLILVGRNGMKIAYGEESYEETGGATITVPLKEDSWYHVPRTVKDIITRLRRTEYHGDPVTRSQFMAVLTDVEVVLLRGTYHTDQVESVLEQADLFSGSHSTTDSSASSSGFIELCECPEGYRGTSCEQCAFGYVRIYETSVTHERIGRCIPCSMCNGHAASCDLETGECGLCLHNTVGTNCERCLPGFYGNATLGRPDDCKRCACPLESPSNNFSPNCQSRGGSSDPSEYVCTQCPEGYTGDHCEFGNTEGWRCERCKTGYWGVPDDGCEPCSCSELGALENVCDVTTGQCICKPRYGGRRCDECDVGYGNLDLDCPACACNVNGSVSTVCNVVSGQCECNVGTEGIHCDRCREEFFGLSDEQPGACEAQACPTPRDDDDEPLRVN